MTFLLLFLAAWACPPTASEVGRARAAYDDAEVDIAAGILGEAFAQLGCQTGVVQRAVLLELYRLDALVSLSRAEDRRAVEAIMRAVTVDPLDAPPPSYGPELVDLHRSWAGRLSGNRARVSVLGGGTVWIDGEPLRHGQEVTVVKGHHLVQIEGLAGITSVLDVLDRDRNVVTGVPSPETVRDPRPTPGPVAPPVVVRTPRFRPVALWIVGGGLAAVGAGTAALAARQEKKFHATVYDDFNDVDRDAVRIRGMYIAGYSALGAGGLVLGTGAIGLPRRAR